MLHRLSPDIAVGFIGQLHVAHDPAIPFDGLIHAFALDREGAGIVVRHAVNQQDRMLDLIRIHEWGNLQVHLRGFPQGAPLALEAERGQGAVISAATGHASPEQVAMGEQVGGHKRAITVAPYSHPATVGNAHFYGFINSSFGAGDNLVNISIVHGVRVANYRHGGVIQNGVSLGEQE